MSKRRIGLIAVVAAAGWAAWALVTAPPPAQSLPTVVLSTRPLVRGAYHVHSLESDGTGSIAEIAAAAARAGLSFVIVTDHGDGARAARAPRYYSGVLCLEEVEVSTADGHYVALGLPTAPYPLGGEGRDVVEDVARLGGFGIAAHPDSAKRDLQWREWNVPLPGLEWFNGDSQWRDEQRWRLPPTLLRYLWRAPESVATLFDRPSALLERWDAMSQTRPVVALAGHDAHQRLGLQGGVEPEEERFYLKLPRYEQVFRSFSTVVEVDNPLRRKADVDAPALLDAIRAGHVYTAIDAVATPAALRFEARVGDWIARMGETVPLYGPIAISARSNAPPGSSIVLFRNGRPIDTRNGSALNWFGDQPGVYRVEVRVAGAPGRPPIPWIVSNPIRIGMTSPPAATMPAATAVLEWPAVPWTVERDSTSSATVTASVGETGHAIGIDYELGRSSAAGQYVAIVTDHVSPVRDAGRLAFRVSADRPMRASVQVRQRANDPDLRWRRSFYADTTPRDIVVPLDHLRSVKPDGGMLPDAERVAALMFVVDRINTPAGSRGRLVIERLRTER